MLLFSRNACVHSTEASNPGFTTCLDHIVYTGARKEEKQAAARLISSHTLTATSRTCTHPHTHAYSHTHTHTRTCTHTQSLCICRSLQRGEASSSACDQAATFLNFASAAAGPAVQAACQGRGDPDQPGMVFSGAKLVPLVSWKGASLGPDVRFGSTLTAVHCNSWLFIKLMPKGVVFSFWLSKLYTESTELIPANQKLYSTLCTTGCSCRITKVGAELLNIALCLNAKHFVKVA